MRQRALLCLAVSLAACRSAQGQQGHLVSRAVTARACPEGLAALHLASAPSSHDVYMSYDSVRDTTFVNFEPRGMLLSSDEGIDMVMAFTRFGGKAPNSSAGLELNLFVTSRAPRPLPERELTFIGDDTVPVHISPSLTSAGDQLPNGDVRQEIFYMFSRDQAIAALRGKRVEGRLGTTSFRFTDRERDGLRGLLLYLMCGSR